MDVHHLLPAVDRDKKRASAAALGRPPNDFYRVSTAVRVHVNGQLRSPSERALTLHWLAPGVSARAERTPVPLVVCRMAATIAAT